MIKKLTLAQAREIYNQYLIYDFPENEVKPMQNIEEMWQQNGYFVYGYFNEMEELQGYAFFSRCPGEKVLLLDYLAILKQFRESGIGSKFLRALSAELCDMDVIIIETEDIQFANSKKEELERKRRDAFYERNGVIKTALVSSVYDANYRVWYLGCKRNDVISTLELKKMYDDIYRFMLSKKGFEERYKVDIEDNSR